MSAEKVEALAEVVHCEWCDADLNAPCTEWNLPIEHVHKLRLDAATRILASPAMRDLLAEAWFDGYSKGNLDGYFGTRDERAKSPYADLDPYREEQS